LRSCTLTFKVTSITSDKISSMLDKP
jgi:hypothetical protein